MFIKSHKFKLKVILGGMLASIFLIILVPFINIPVSGLIFQNTIQGAMAVSIFLIVVYLWNEFNKLRIEMNKEELEDKKLTELEHNIEKLSKNYKK